MVYRIKGGRSDNGYGPKTRSELEIWANGLKIARVELHTIIDSGLRGVESTFSPITIGYGDQVL
jgi:hypothetical protein